MFLALLLACGVHLGVPPSRGYAVVRVDAPVAEPDIDVRVRAAVESALAARGASGSEALLVLVERASWTPSRREGELVLYTAELHLRLAAGGRTRVAVATSSVPGPANAALAREARAQAFAALAERAAAEGVTWLLYGAPQ